MTTLTGRRWNDRGAAAAAAAVTVTVTAAVVVAAAAAAGGSGVAVVGAETEVGGAAVGGSPRNSATAVAGRIMHRRALPLLTPGRLPWGAGVGLAVGGAVRIARMVSVTEPAAP